MSAPLILKGVVRATLQLINKSVLAAALVTRWTLGSNGDFNSDFTNEFI